jgi:hypothetical protein
MPGGFLIFSYLAVRYLNRRQRLCAIIFMRAPFFRPSKKADAISAKAFISHKHLI